MHRLLRQCGLVLLVCAVASNLWAQDQRVRLSGVVSAAVGAGGPAPAIGVTGGFHLAPHAGFEIEALYIPSQDFDDRGPIFLANSLSYVGLADSFNYVGSSTSLGAASIAIFPPPQIETTSRTVAFLSSFVGDLPVGRVRPYVQFGGGIANVERRFSVTYGPFPLSRAPLSLFPVPISPIRYSVSNNYLAWTAGAGLDVALWKGLALAADVRYMHLFGSANEFGEDADITRIGARASWRF